MNLRVIWWILGVPLILAPTRSTLRADDWPEWLGPGRDGHSKETGWLEDWPPGGPPRSWEKKIGSGYSAIVVADGRLILFHRQGERLVVDAIDAETGANGWSHSYPTTYVDRYGYDGGPRCAPIIVGDTVYTLGPQGVLHSLDATTGAVRWKVDLETEHSLDSFFFGVGATPIIDDGTLYCHMGGTGYGQEGTGLTFAIDAATGKLRWKTPNDGGSYASPVLATVDGTKRLFVFHRGGLSAHDPATGEEKWKYPWSSRTYESVNAAVPLVVGNELLFTATYGTGAVCLEIGKDNYEKVLWSDSLDRARKILEVHWAPPCYRDGWVYGFSGRHTAGSSLRCVEMKTGRVAWSWPAEESRLGRGSLISSDGRWIALGEYGDLVLLRMGPDGPPKELARVPRILSYPAWTVPTLANGRLYLRDLERLICLDLRTATKTPGAKSPQGTGDSR